MNVYGWKCLRNGIKCADKQKRWRKVWRFPYLPLPLHCIINKGIIMENLGTSLNPVQLHLLEMFESKVHIFHFLRQIERVGHNVHLVEKIQSLLS